VSDPVDLYARRLERAIIEAQAVLGRATQPWGISEREALRVLLDVLDNENLLGVMVHNGAHERYPEAISLQDVPWRAKA
jgi:hypothetical protein